MGILKRVFNFNAGPAALPEQVLIGAQIELLNYKDTGMSVMEMSHRGVEYEQVHARAQTLFKRLYELPDGYEVLFLQGGASLQFFMVPLNLLPKEGRANYILTGVWSEKALAEAERVGQVYVGASTKETGYKQIPDANSIVSNADDAYMHITTNNTIAGTQWHQLPQPQHGRLVADMSSDIMSRPLDMSQFALVYAGAQKNLGPAGLTVVVLRQDLAFSPGLPTMLDYRTYLEKDSLYNTPPTFAIYMLAKVLEWITDLGGLQVVAKRNEEKAAMLYEAIDSSDGFYRGHSNKSARSQMNVTFTLPTPALSQEFVEMAAAKGMVGLAGHRSVGGCRASIYNAVPTRACSTLAQFMQDFRKRKGYAK